MATGHKEMRQKKTPPLVSLRTLRLAYGLSIPALVERIADEGERVDPDHISNCELGWKKPGIGLLHAWLRALNVNPLDVYSDMVPATDTARVAS